MATWDYLRARQGEHALILLSDEEFAALREKRHVKLPQRHHEHFGRSLRRGSDWQALVGDGKGLLSEATVSKGEIRLGEDAQLAEMPRRAREVIIAQAWVKPKALSLLLTKCAEIGVAEIVLFESEHSAPHGDTLRRISAILENACMQAYNPVCPRIALAAALPVPHREGVTCLFGDTESRESIALVPRSKTVLFVNGPEGGFSKAEITRLRDAARGVLISENVLRAETAAIIAAGILCLPP